MTAAASLSFSSSMPGASAPRRQSRIEQADHRLHVGLGETGVQPRFVETPIPVPGGRSEQQQEHVTARERTADLTTPVHPRGDVDVGYEAVDHLPVEALDGVLHLDRQRMVIVLVTDEHRELVVADGHRLVLPPGCGPITRYLDPSMQAPGIRARSLDVSSP